MAQVVFLVGRPGSGKSHIARCITGEMKDVKSCLPAGWTATRVADYEFLHAWFQAEQNNPDLDPRERFFEASEHGGFRVIKFSILRKALEEVNKIVCQQLNEAQKLILVEFARDSYTSDEGIWNAFDARITNNAAFLYIQTNLNECMKRVRRRARRRIDEGRNDVISLQDDAFVPEDIVNGYYQEERHYELTERFGDKRVFIIHNDGEWRETWAEVQHSINCFVDVPLVSASHVEAPSVEASPVYVPHMEVSLMSALHVEVPSVEASPVHVPHIDISLINVPERIGA